MMDEKYESNLRERMKGHISELMDIDITDINDDSDIISMGANSMVIVQLYVMLQEEYGLMLQDELDLHVGSITINDIIDLAKKKLETI